MSPGRGTLCDVIFGEISSSYEDIVLTWFYGSLNAVTFTFDPLIPKSYQHICEPKYTCGKLG